MKRKAAHAVESGPFGSAGGLPSPPRASDRGRETGTGIAPRRRGPCRCGIISLVAGGLRVMSGNRLSDKLFVQVNHITPESCRLFLPACSTSERGRNRLGPASRAGDYPPRTFPQVGRVVAVYRPLLRE